MNAHAHEIPERDARGLRDFALGMAGIVAVLFGLAFPWFLDAPWPRWPWVLAAVLAVWGLAAPATLRPVYRGWMRFGLLLNRIVSPVVLGAMFFLLFTPVAMVMKLIGRDPMTRGFDARASTYRVRSETPDRSHMERPF